MRRFTMVMGTGMVANAATTLPVHVPVVAVGTVWLLAAVLLVRFLVTTRDWGRTPFLGAPAMALLTVGLHFPAHLGALGLWWTGTALGVFSALAVPRPRDLGAVWLLPVVPPMVSAATGTVLDERLTPVCLGLFALALVRALPVLGAVLRDRADEPALLWIPLGVLGQSVTAAQHLGLPFYGPPVLALALAWLAYVAVRAARDRRPFSPAWWSFTFPLGTVVTGSAAVGLGALAVVLYGVLVGLWVVVGTAQLRAYSSTKRARTRGGSMTSASRERSTTASASWGSK